MEKISRRSLVLLLGAIPAWLSGNKATAYAVTHPSPKASKAAKTGVKSILIPIKVGSTQLALSKLAVGNSVSASIVDTTGANKSAKEVVAYSAICTHSGCTVGSGAKTFVCPCHGSTYDSTTGAVINGPAPKSLAPFPVVVQSGMLFIKG
jgi:Rieske Fe-S protein